MCATPMSVAYSPTYFMMMNHFPATLNYPQSRHIKTIQNLGLILDPFWAIYGEVSSIRGKMYCWDIVMVAVFRLNGLVKRENLQDTMFFPI